MTDPTDRPDLLIRCRYCDKWGNHSPCEECSKAFATPAPSGGQADQPVEPSERELPDRPGLWERGEDRWGDKYEIYVRGDSLYRRYAGFYGTTIVSGETKGLPKGGWRPAVPDTDAYADATKLVEEILGTDKLTYLQLRAERDRLREAVKAEIAQRNAFIAEINSVLPEPNGMTCKERIVLMRAERDRFQEGWIASNELVEHLRAEQKAWQAAMDQVAKLRAAGRRASDPLTPSRLAGVKGETMPNPAAVAYEAYRESVNASQHRDVYLLSWGQLSEAEKEAWWCVVRALFESQRRPVGPEV
jgi:hypothetical protein